MFAAHWTGSGKRAKRQLVKSSSIESRDCTVQEVLYEMTEACSAVESGSSKTAGGFKPSNPQYEKSRSIPTSWTDVAHRCFTSSWWLDRLRKTESPKEPRRANLARLLLWSHSSGKISRRSVPY